MLFYSGSLMSVKGIRFSMLSFDSFLLGSNNFVSFNL